MTTDLLDGAAWECGSTHPGAATKPGDLGSLPLQWMAVTVPGTAASALADQGVVPVASVDFDASDWWFRCRLPRGATGPQVLEIDGLATVADVWFRGEHLLHSESMFEAHALDVASADAGDEIVVCCHALAPLLVDRRPRPRWKTMMATHQALRWFRTTLVGRQPGWAVTPAPVGPWRPMRLRSAEGARLVSRRIVAAAEGDGAGTITMALRIAGLPSTPATASAQLRAIGAPDVEVGVEGGLSVRAEGAEVVVEGVLQVRGVERWWPHTHGPQPRYALTIEVGRHTIDIGRVGFRSVSLDRSDGGFVLQINGVPVFCRGACWWPVDPVRMAPAAQSVRATLELVRDAHMNMVRIPGGTVYEDDTFWDVCDELGIMVWQDCMLGYVDPPADEQFERQVVAEVEQALGRLGGRPALAVVCGGQELDEQPAMLGVPRQRWGCRLVDDVIPAVVEQVLPGVPYVTTSPTGGDLPFAPATGDCHYWGVGSYLRSVEDARRCGIRFMSEGLAFATPPERPTVEDACGGAIRAGHDPTWKQALHHDTGRSWDLEDVRDFYVTQLYGGDPHLLRYLDPERALDLGRAVVAELMERVMVEWRRPGSPSAGALVVALRDLVPGAGWGIIDALGRPKAPWFVLRRVLAPVSILVTDEGLNGLHLHVLNDTAEAFAGKVCVDLYTRSELRVEHVEGDVVVGARGHTVLDAGSLFEGFRDLSYAYRFGPLSNDVVVAGLHDGAGSLVGEAVFLPGGPDRPVEPDIGLRATAQPAPAGHWDVSVTTRRFAQRVVVEVPGFRPGDSWFHLAPGTTRTVSLRREKSEGEGGPPVGYVRALNAQTPVKVVVEATHATGSEESLR